MLNKIVVLCFILVAAVSFADDGKKTTVKADKKNKKSNEDDSTLFLESTIVGDKEQPTVSYFIPWKGVGTPDKLHWNIEQKNDGTLDLIDRNVMIRSMSIYNELEMEQPAVAE